MELQHANRRQSPVLPVLYVGTALPGGVIRELWESGIGLLHFTNARPALRLLQHCRIDAVLCGASSLEGIEEFRAFQVPVIVLATGDQEWNAEGVTVVDLRSEPATVAALVRHALAARAPWVAA